jgi:hypothetical protein
MQRPRPESTVTIHTRQTAPTQFVDAAGVWLDEVMESKKEPPT